MPKNNNGYKGDMKMGSSLIKDAVDKLVPVLEKYGWEHQFCEPDMIKISKNGNDIALRIARANPFYNKELSNSYLGAVVYLGRMENDIFKPIQKTGIPLGTSQGFLTLQANLSWPGK